MKQLLFFLVGLALSLKGFSGSVQTICAGVWDDGSIWSSGQVPDMEDSVFVRHCVSIDGKYLVDSHALIINSSGALCGNDSMTVLSTGKIIIDGYLNLGENYINVKGPIKGKGIYTGGLLITNGGSFSAGKQSSSPYFTDVGGRCYPLVNRLACDSLSILSPSGNLIWDEDGLYLDTLNGVQCDSVIAVQVTLMKEQFTAMDLSDCDSVVSPSGNHVWYASGSYEDTLTSLAGCDSVLTIDVTVNHDCACNVFVPNVFTPDGDGVNDLFYARSTCHLEDFEFMVFNKRGILIWKTTDINQGWDGTMAGNTVQLGVYFYRITYTEEQRGFVERLGRITKIR